MPVAVCGAGRWRVRLWGLAAPWAAARPRAVRATSFARRVGSKPGQAPPPPAGTAAWPAGFAAASNRLGCLCVVRPGPDVAHRHRGLAPPPPAGPASALTHIAAELPNFAYNSPTTLSNLEIRSLELQRFQTLLKLHLIELHASFLGSGHVDACWWCSWIPLARCAVV